MGQKEERYQKLSSDQKKTISFEEFSRQSHVYLNWNVWMKVWKQMANPKFLFCVRGINGYIVNVPNVVWVINKHYQSFKELVGRDFQPYELVLEIQNEESKFWSQMDKPESAQAHYLWGLLYGYGEKNAFLFKSMYEGMSGLFGVFYTENQYRLLQTIDDYELNVEDLPLPQFRSFTPADEEIEKYQRERVMIQSIFHESEFLPKVLETINPELETAYEIKGRR